MKRIVWTAAAILGAAVTAQAQGREKAPADLWVGAKKLLAKVAADFKPLDCAKKASELLKTLK